MKVVALGTYDIGKPRMRILLRGLQENGVDVTKCHVPVWDGIEDKSQFTGLGNKLALFGRFLFAYPKLIIRYWRLPPHDVVFIGYLGLFDVLVLWPFIKLRRKPIVWDVFISLYNTVVEDRELLSKKNPISWVLYSMEWFALRLANHAIIDTETHAQYIRKKYRCPHWKVSRVFVGGEPEAFTGDEQVKDKEVHNETIKVLFYGQFIPLHGIDTIVRAAAASQHENIDWLLIGKGQESVKVNALVAKLQPTNLQLIEWVNYGELIDYLLNTDIALGIFGMTDKATRVIPNKVFQILLSNKPLITMDSPAIREIIDLNNPYNLLIPANDPAALVSAVLKMENILKEKGLPQGSSPYKNVTSPKYCGGQLVDVFHKLLNSRLVHSANGLG
jgi:glycosyltransferase involved in cell wall biosynthesis